MSNRVGPATVLVIEDNQIIRALLQDLLQDSGFRPIIASGIAEALALAPGGTPDAILTDTFGISPGSTDVSFLKPLLTAWPGVPIILCTARKELDGISPRSVGLFAVIMKPFNVDDVVAAVEQAVSLDRDRDPAAAFPRRVS